MKVDQVELVAALRGDGQNYTASRVAGLLPEHLNRLAFRLLVRTASNLFG